MIKAVIFDKDGVLIDTEYAYIHSYNQVLKHHDKAPSYTLQQRKHDAGKPSDIIFKEFQEKYDVATPVEKLKKINFEGYMRYFEEEGVKVFDGVLECIKKLKERKILLGVATGASREPTDYTLKRPGLYDFFDSIVTASDVTNGKPHPETVLKVAEHLHVSPQECVVIGDSINDQQGAYAAGMKFIIFNPSAEEVSFQYDMMIQDFKDIDVEKILSL